MTLHVTNGDSAAGKIREAGFEPLLSWKDVLHEGPVPDTADLNRTRAQFLSGCGWGDFNTILAEMQQRDSTLLAADSVVLWFEHDLYDQLQLIQILSMLKHRPEMICVDRYLGPMSSAQIQELWPLRVPVSDAQIDLAKRSWQAFRSSDPEALQELVKQDLSALAFLQPALLRLLDDYPQAANGLSRTERQILQIAALAPDSFEDLFTLTQALESAPYIGDSSLKLHLAALTNCRVPLLRNDRIDLTRAGIDVIESTANHVALNGLDRWLGGVHLQA